MKVKNSLHLTILAIGLSTAGAFAQDTKEDKHTLDIKIPEVAILDIEGGRKTTAISLTAIAPTEAGLPLDFSKSINTDLWINYSSIVGRKSDPVRDVTVQITSGDVPPGLEVTVEASKDAGRGEGTVGSPLGSLVLSTSAQIIIDGIGSVYTGNGATAGHNLTYQLNKKAGAYGDIDFDLSTSMVVTYTISDN